VDSIKDVENFGIRAKGQAERIKFLEGKPLTRAQAMVAHCYDCCGGFCDGVRDCEIENCSLYPFMPYAKRKDKMKTVRSEKQIEASRKLSLLRSGGSKKSMLQELT
jgi:hypothetical protein